MTQELINTVNNLQEMMAQGHQKVQGALFEVSATDKNFDAKFEKIYEKQINKENDIKQQSINNFNEESEFSLKTLGDIKNSYRNEPQTTIDTKTLREVIAEATGEANVETSLDLTLNRDINEVISQFKDVVDKTIMSNDETMTDIETSTNEDTKIMALYQQLLSLTEKVEIVAPVTETEEEIVDFTNIEEAVDVATEITKSEKNEQEVQKLEEIVDEEILKELNIESVDVETADTGNGSLMEHQSPQEQAVKAMLQQDVETFEMKLENVNNVQSSQTAQPKTVEANPSKIIDQIAKQMEGLQNSSKVNIVLNPESLGKVTVQLIKTGEGLSAQFTVASQEVRDMLMKGFDGLKETLLAQGVSVDNVSVKLNEAQKSEYNADWTEQEGSRGGNKQDGRSQQNEKDKNAFEQMMAQFNEENGKV